MALDLNGKVALVTGGSGGVGEAVVRRLAGLGATVAILDVADENGERLAAELGGDSCYRHLDVTDPDAWESTLAELLGTLGRIDVAHLNAGIMSRPIGESGLTDPIPNLTAETYRRVMAVNVDGVYLGIVALLPHLEPDGGDIVVTGSVAGLMPYPLDPLYSLSKHAVVGLVRSLGPALSGRSVRLNAVCPGGVDTALVPPDVRSFGGLSPASYIADTLVSILESGASGDVWVAPDVNMGAWALPPANLLQGSDGAGS
jgi:NAD(P)-dependent dehydrogenase (short-subunit alcohol dehydrogenase family)